MLCSQREVQALVMLTHIERDTCLTNSLSMSPRLTMGRDCPLCVILPHRPGFLLHCSRQHARRSTGFGVIWSRSVSRVFHSFCESSGRSCSFSEQQLLHIQKGATWDQIRCSVHMFYQVWNIIQMTGTFVIIQRIAQDYKDRSKYILSYQPEYKLFYKCPERCLSTFHIKVSSPGIGGHSLAEKSLLCPESRDAHEVLPKPSSFPTCEISWSAFSPRQQGNNVLLLS